MVTPSHIRQLLGNLISVRNWSGITLGIAIAVFTCRPHTSAQAAAKLAPLGKAEERSRVAFSHALTKMDGANLKVFIVEVIYGPGGSSPSHSHPCPVIGYVIEGAYRTQVKGEPEAIYKAG